MKIGLLRLSSLGDVVLATSCIKPLREAHPDSEVLFITKSEYADVFNNNPNLNGVVGWSKGEPFKELLARVRAERLDALVDLHSTPRSRSLSAFSGAKEVLRYRKSHLARRISVVSKKKPPAKHVVQRYMEALTPLLTESCETAPALYPTEEDNQWVSRFLTDAGIREGPLVAIAPGGRKMTKRWPAVKYGRLASGLASDPGAGVVMLGDEADKEVNARVLEESREVMDTTGKTDIGKFAALLSRSDVLISNDSAPVHVAVATGTPVIAVFGPTVVEFGFAPYGRGNFVVERDLYCRPCSLHGTEKCPEGHFRCMEEIGWDDVHEAARRILQGGRQEPEV